jgi:hypothetical protein
MRRGLGVAADEAGDIGLEYVAYLAGKSRSPTGLSRCWRYPLASADLSCDGKKRGAGSKFAFARPFSMKAEDVALTVTPLPRDVSTATQA